MKNIVIALFVCAVTIFIHYNPSTTKEDLSTYVGHDVEIAREIHQHHKESRYYVDYSTDSSICTAVLGKQEDRYYYINTPKCERVL